MVIFAPYLFKWSYLPLSNKWSYLPLTYFVIICVHPTLFIIDWLHITEAGELLWWCHQERVHRLLHK